VRLVTAFFRSLARRKVQTSEEKLAWFLLISTIPGALLGAALEGFVEDQLGRPLIIGILMIVMALVLWVVDRSARQTRDLTGLRWPDSVWIGLAQALALAPGVSRSGITIVTGRALSLRREAAVRYSFLLSVPIIAGAAALKGYELAQSGMPAGTAMPFVLGIASAAVGGFLAIAFLLRYIRTHGFGLFVIYRLAVGSAVIIAIIVGVRHAAGI
jgi:undecaprenyl-diphosphatase